MEEGSTSHTPEKHIDDSFETSSPEMRRGDGILLSILKWTEFLSSLILSRHFSFSIEE